MPVKQKIPLRKRKTDWERCKRDRARLLFIKKEFNELRKVVSKIYSYLKGMKEDL